MVVVVVDWEFAVGVAFVVNVGGGWRLTKESGVYFGVGMDRYVLL